MDITVLGVRYTVIYDDPSVWSPNGMGRADLVEGVIHLNSQMPEDIQKATLLHEVFHILSGNLGVGLKEDQVEAMASGTFAFIKENKGLFNE